jgi:hypothetical protein
VFASVAASAADVARPLPGDDLVPDADVVMDRAFDLAAAPAEVWPWFVQLGKRRAGWYLPRWVERLVPRSRCGLRHLEPDLLAEARVGHVIPDWGGRNATFEIAILEPPHVLVHTTRRGRTDGSWAIVLTPYDAHPRGTHVQLRLRLSPVGRKWLARTLGEAIDAATVAGLAAGLRERLS